jgi:hypothetical protein
MNRILGLLTQWGLDERFTPIDHELRPLARADRRVVLLDTIPGFGDLLG